MRYKNKAAHARCKSIMLIDIAMLVFYEIFGLLHLAYIVEIRRYSCKEGICPYCLCCILCKIADNYAVMVCPRCLNYKLREERVIQIRQLKELYVRCNMEYGLYQWEGA